MTLRYGNRPIPAFCLALLLSLALLGCGQVNSGKWYDSDKAERTKPSVSKTQSGKSQADGTSRLSSIWNRVTTAIDRRPDAQRARMSKTAQNGMINVRKGDTYYALSQRHKVPLNALLRANKARPPYALAAGDRLVLPQQQFYKVKPKDTLYSISRRHKTDAASLARLNGVARPFTLNVGQMLQIPGATSENATQTSKQAAAPSQTQRSKAAKAKKPKRLAAAPRRVGRFRVPVTGPVISNYGPKEGGLHNDGINIAARAGTPIVAAENGVVVYAGNELRGYGNLLLIRHSDGWVTAYAHASTFTVKPGDRVKQGDKVAEVGQTGNVDRPQLHFELRKGTRAVNPKSLI